MINIGLFEPFPMTTKKFKSRYRSLVKRWHPDAIPGANDFGMFVNIQETYEMLLQNLTNRNFFELTVKEKQESSICIDCQGQGFDYDFVRGIMVRKWRCGVCKGTGVSSYKDYLKWVHMLTRTDLRNEKSERVETK